MSLGTLKLRTHDGEELFTVASASVTFYREEDGQFATTFRVETAPPAAETSPRGRKPWAEFTLPLPKPPAIALLTGKTYALAQGIDPASREALTNFYYHEHEPVDQVAVTIVERQPDRARIHIEGVTPHPVIYDGSAPPAKIVIDAVFTLVFNRL